MRSRASLVSRSSSGVGSLVGASCSSREPAPRAGERQTLDKQQVLDAQDPLEVCAPIDTRPARALCDSQIRKLCFPRAQHVGLHLRNLADFRLPEQRPVGDLDGGH
jgi:hypothetical protein